MRDPARNDDGPPIPDPPTGPTQVPVGEIAFYTAVADDPEGDLVYYFFSWGDGTSTATGHYPSGTPVTIPHAFPYENVFEVEVWAFDEHGDAASGLPCWSEPLLVAVGGASLPEADVAIALDGDPDQVSRGEVVTYTSTVSNLGPDPAEGVTFSQVVPRGMSVRRKTTTQGACTSTRTSVDCDLGTVAAGASVIVTVDIGTRRPGNFSITAAVDSASPQDPTTSNNSATVATVVKR